MVLPLALSSLWLAMRRGEGWRDAFLRAAVLFGVLLAFLTEALGSVHQLDRPALLVSWSAITAAALWFGVRRLEIPRLSRPPWFETALVAGVVAILTITFCIAVLSPPNTADAMAYHMPRVVYWAEERAVSFFPTAYFNQISQPPLAEYFMLHTYVLSGGDHFVNLVQWLGFAASAVGVSLVAGLFGAGRRGQVLAAVFAATLPNGILQSSGAKNDCLLALWLVALAYFILRFLRSFDTTDMVAACASLALALFTKATAYLYAPPLLLAIFFPFIRRLGAACVLRFLAAATLFVVVVNGPFYIRNLEFSGSPLGYDSAQGDGFFRWSNGKFGWRVTVSNLLRNTADQLGGRSPRWNQDVYDWVVRIHRWIRAGVNDPATTWPWTNYEPPRNANHEANAPNRWHLLLAGAVLVWLMVNARRRFPELVYLLALLAGFILFCSYLRWQLYLARLFLPLFILSAPVVGSACERLRPQLLQALLCLLLLNNARPFLFENWTRPLKGPHSLLRTPRDERYFADMTQWGDVAPPYFEAARTVRASGCETVGIDISHFQLEYPLQALLREERPGIRFVHTGVDNASSRYKPRSWDQPCAVVCLGCAGQQDRLKIYRDWPKTIRIDTILVFLR